MIFSELYSIYYTTVAKIISMAFEKNTTENDLQNCIMKEAFAESILTILPSIKSGKWPLLDSNLKPVINNNPTMPLTLLEKRWLKAILLDDRLQLFDVKISGLDDITPLFSNEDYKIYDQYEDGDPFKDENYIANFRMIFSAIKNKHPIKIALINNEEKEITVCFLPKRFEYSIKDNKIRIITNDYRFKRFNLSKVVKCEYYTGQLSPVETRVEIKKNLTLEIIDKYNTLERAMIHFAHFEKKVERLSNEKYILKLKYYEHDETEMVIRVLSFGPYIKALEPESFVDLIKHRLISQKNKFAVFFP